MSSTECSSNRVQPRIEVDSLGEREVPGDVYYGIQTLRGHENFRITGYQVHPMLIRSLAIVKKATALANAELGRIPQQVAAAISQAVDEVIEGKLDREFILDPIQGGAGTSINMNVNEVLANRAIEILGGQPGDYAIVSPLNHVNMGQSTNDAVPTAARIALLKQLDPMLRSLETLVNALELKAYEFKDALKMGRTHLQDAVPITAGQEFGAWAKVIKRDIARIREAADELHTMNLGGTAVGTGLNANVRYIGLVRELLQNVSGLEFRTADDLVDATQNVDAMTNVSACLKVCAVNLCKIANDVRLLASGPSAGLHELILPAVQPGSSIMPAKVNPVIAEVVNQVAFQIMGNDLTVSMAAQAGQLELNVFMPVLLFNLLQSVDILGNVARTFAEKCISGINVNRDRCLHMVEANVGIVTALVPHLGYGTATDVAKEAQRTGNTVRNVVLERGLMSEAELDRVLSIANMTNPAGA